MSFHPGCNANEFAVLRWTSPVNASCKIDVQFFAGDQGETNANITRNTSVSLFSADKTSAEPVFSDTVALEVGDTIDIAVGTTDSCLYDSTPASVTIDCS